MYSQFKTGDFVRVLLPNTSSPYTRGKVMKVEQNGDQITVEDIERYMGSTYLVAAINLMLIRPDKMPVTPTNEDRARYWYSEGGGRRFECRIVTQIDDTVVVEPVPYGGHQFVKKYYLTKIEEGPENQKGGPVEINLNRNTQEPTASQGPDDTPGEEEKNDAQLAASNH